jgi:hypothetical protein
MANALPAEKQQSGLETIWRKYRAQAMTSRRLKQEQGTWRRVLLIATIVALVATPLAKTLDKLNAHTLASIWVWVATFLFAATAWLNKEVLGDDSEQPWVRARQAAEGVKAVAFRFLMGVPPFAPVTGSAPAIDRADEILSKAPAPETVDADEAKNKLPPVPLTPALYIQHRLDDQIAFYDKSVKDERKIDGNIRVISLALSGSITLFGAAGALIAKEYSDIWAPALALLSTTVTTQMTRARHRFLIESYSRSAERLRSVKAKWTDSAGKPEDDDAMVLAVEDVLSNENGGWVQQMLLKPVVPDQGAAANKKPAA